jgi:hypothetical protein
MNLTNRNMKKQYGEIRYSNWNFIPGIICCIVSYFFKKFFQCILYLKKDHRPASNSFPLKIVNTDSLYVFDPGQNPFAATYIGHIPFDEPQETKAIFTVVVQTPIPFKVPDRYKPLILPPILHGFPENYHKYLPRFDGEYGSITAEKHIQGFEHFLDLFEVEEDDVCIRIFSLSLQGKAKEWFKNFPAASIGDFHQFVKVFLDKWVIKRNPFLILEEYNHLKRHPGETVQHF